MRTLKALLLISTAAPALAADGPTVAELEQKLAIVSAEQKLEAAQDARFKALVATLGLAGTATGKTELKAKGGELEAWMLSARSIDAAADAIATSEAATAATSPIVLLAADEPFEPALATSVRSQLEAVQEQLADAITSAKCAAPPAAAGGEEAPIEAAGAFALAPLIGSIIGAIKTDTEISGAEGPTEPRLIVNALAGRGPAGRWIVPKDASVIPDPSGLAELWRGVSKKRAEAVACSAAAKAPNTPAGKLAAARLTGAVAAADAAETVLVRGTTMPTPLVAAIRIETIMARKPQVMRVYVEEAGGSLLLRKNLFTMLGAPAVGITGGSVISWRMVDPQLGTVTGGGLLICRTHLTNLRAVHANRLGRAGCTAEPER